jgi:hypothetical protein
MVGYIPVRATGHYIASRQVVTDPVTLDRQQ